MSTEDYMPRRRRLCLSVQTLLLLCVTLADKQCSANSTAASLAITLQLITGTFTVAVEVQRGRIQTSTMANQVWIVLPSAL